MLKRIWAPIGCVILFMLAGLLTPLIVALTVQVMVFLLGLVSILYVMVGGEPTDSTGES